MNTLARAGLVDDEPMDDEEHVDEQLVGHGRWLVRDGVGGRRER